MIPDVVRHIMFEFEDDPWLSDQTIKAQYLIGRLIKKHGGLEVKAIIGAFDVYAESHTIH